MRLYLYFRVFLETFDQRLTVNKSLSGFLVSVCILAQDSRGGIRLLYLHSLYPEHKATKITMVMNVTWVPIAFTCPILFG